MSLTRKCYRILGFSIGKTRYNQWRVLRPQWFIGFLQLFTYRIMIYRNKPNTIDSALKIGYDGKYLFLMDKEGQQLPGQISMTIIDRVNKPTVARIELFVNISEIIKINEKTTIPNVSDRLN